MNKNSKQVRKKIVVLSQFCGILDGRTNNRFVFIASLFANFYDVELITSNFYHTEKRRKNVEGEYPFKITLINEPGYKKNISLKRLYSHWVFSKRASRYLKSLQSFDLIYASFPSLSISQIALDVAEKKNIPLVVDLQDLWPEAFQKHLGENIISKTIINILKRKVDVVFSKASGLVAVSESFLERAIRASKNPAFTQALYIGSFPHIENLTAVQKNISKIIKIVYLGSLGESYDLKTAIKAFEIAKQRLLDYSINLSFDIIGDGPKKGELEVFANKIKSQVSFKGLLPYSEVSTLLPHYDIALNPIVSWSVASIINKHGDYALAGLPVINSQKNNEYKNLLAEYHCGISCEPENLEEMGSAIVQIASNPDVLFRMRQNALKMGFEKFNRINTYNKLVENIKIIL